MIMRKRKKKGKERELNEAREKHGEKEEKTKKDNI